jgi:hypothetical protein
VGVETISDHYRLVVRFELGKTNANGIGEIIFRVTPLFFSKIQVCSVRVRANT